MEKPEHLIVDCVTRAACFERRNTRIIAIGDENNKMQWWGKETSELKALVEWLNKAIAWVEEGNADKASNGCEGIYDFPDYDE